MITGAQGVETGHFKALAFEITSQAACEQAFAARRPPHSTRALPITSATWQKMYTGQLPAHMEPWWMAVQCDNTQAQSYFWVAPDLPCFAGHFPGQPILPGVMQLDWAVQLASSLWPAHTPASRFSGMARVKFKAPVVPDTVLSLVLNKHPAEPKRSGQRISMTLRSSTEELTSARLLYRD